MPVILEELHDTFTGAALRSEYFEFLTILLLGIVYSFVTDGILIYCFCSGLGGFGRNKGILGFLGGAAFCFPFNYRMLSIAKFGAKGIPGGQTSLVLVSAALGLAGAFADLAVPTPAWTLPKRICGVRVPPFHLDDNFVVPIFSAFACTKIFDAVGWSQNLPLGTFLLV